MSEEENNGNMERVDKVLIQGNMMSLFGGTWPFTNLSMCITESEQLVRNK